MEPTTMPLIFRRGTITEPVTLGGVFRPGTVTGPVIVDLGWRDHLPTLPTRDDVISALENNVPEIVGTTLAPPLGLAYQVGMAVAPEQTTAATNALASQASDAASRIRNGYNDARLSSESWLHREFPFLFGPDEPEAPSQAEGTFASSFIRDILPILADVAQNLPSDESLDRADAFNDRRNGLDRLPFESWPAYFLYQSGLMLFEEFIAQWNQDGNPNLVGSFLDQLCAELSTPDTNPNSIGGSLGFERFLPGFSLRDAINDFQNGRPILGTLNAALALADFVGMGIAGRQLVRAGLRSLARRSADDAAEMLFGRGVHLGGLPEPRTATDFVGGVQIGRTDLNGLYNARNLTIGRLQGQNSTCGLHASLSVIDDVNPARGALDVTRVRGQIRDNRGVGLNQSQVMSFLDRNLPDAVVVPAYGVEEAELVDYLRQGHVIAGVDRNHWVRITGTFREGNNTWVRVYDPARGNYEQLLTSFLTRMYRPGEPPGFHNVIISIRP
jgi:hypothetical protein